MRNDPDAFSLDAFLPYRLAVLASRVSRDLSGTYGERFGLSVPEWRVMAHLAEGSNVSVRDIEARVDMEKSKVSRAAKRLEKRGLLARRPHPTDKRLIALSLTDQGTSVFNQIVPLALSFESELKSRLTASDRDHLDRITDILLKGVTM